MSKKLNEIELEQKMSDDGVKRFQKKQHAIKGTLETSAGVGANLLSGAIDTLKDGIDSWLKREEERKKEYTAKVKDKKDRGVRYAARVGADLHNLMLSLEKTIGSKLIAALASRSILDSISVHKRATRSAMVLANTLEGEWILNKIDADDPVFLRHIKNTLGTKSKCTDAQTSMIREKRIKKYLILTDGKRAWTKWNRGSKLQLGTLLLELFCNSTGITFISNRKDLKGRSYSYISPTPQTLDKLEQWNAHMELLKPVYKPCVIQPQDWTNPFDGGYYSPNLYQTPIIKTRDVSYLKQLDNTDMPEVYEGINRMQHTAWKINTDIFGLIEQFWAVNADVGKLPLREDRTIPDKPDDIETNKEARDEWRRTARDTHDENSKNASQRLGFLKSLALAKEYKDLDEFYFVWQLDWRGRAYPVTYFYLSPQGPDFGKALLLFKEGKPLHTDSAKKHFRVHLANCFGFDKVSLEDRVAWVEDHHEDILSCAEDPYHYNFWEKASSPWCFLSACIEYSEWTEKGDEFLSHIPIAQDATQSGLQLLSLLVLDQEGAEGTNLTCEDSPRDLYQSVADETTRLLREAAATTDKEVLASIKKLQTSYDTRSKKKNKKGESTFNEEKEKRILGSAITQAKILRDQANMWLDLGIDRGMVKRPTMTYVYSASNHSMVAYLKAAAFEKGLKIDQKHMFKSCSFLGRYVKKAMVNKLVGAEAVMNHIKELAKVAIKHSDSIQWTNPVGLPIKQSYLKQDSLTVSTKIDGTIRYRALSIANKETNDRKHKQALSPNIIHSLDAGIMFLVMNKMDKDCCFAMVHDSYATSAADSEELAKNIRQAYYELFSTPVLENLTKEITALIPEGYKDDIPEPLPMGTYKIDNILKSTFMFN